MIIVVVLAVHLIVNHITQHKILTGKNFGKIPLSKILIRKISTNALLQVLFCIE